MFMSIMGNCQPFRSGIVIQINMAPIIAPCNALLFNIARLHLAHSTVAHWHKGNSLHDAAVQWLARALQLHRTVASRVAADTLAPAEL